MLCIVQKFNSIVSTPNAHVYKNMKSRNQWDSNEQLNAYKGVLTRFIHTAIIPENNSAVSDNEILEYGNRPTTIKNRLLIIHRICQCASNILFLPVILFVVLLYEHLKNKQIKCLLPPTRTTLLNNNNTRISNNLVSFYLQYRHLRMDNSDARRNCGGIRKVSLTAMI